MTGERYQDLPPVKRRRLILRAVVRGLLNAAVLVVLYYVLPLDRPRDCDTAVRLLIGLLVFAGVMVWGVRSIAGSRYPGGCGRPRRWVWSCRCSWCCSPPPTS
jgi:hypothetical protein